MLLMATHSEPIFHMTPIFPNKHQVLPEDFHVQTLFVGKPRVRCTISKLQVFSCFSVYDPHRQRCFLGSAASLLPWMVCRCVLARSVSSHELESAWRGAARRSVRLLRQRPVRCVAVGKDSRERETRTVYRHCFLARRGGTMGADGARLLPP